MSKLPPGLLMQSGRRDVEQQGQLLPCLASTVDDVGRHTMWSFDAPPGIGAQGSDVDDVPMVGVDVAGHSPIWGSAEYLWASYSAIGARHSPSVCHIGRSAFLCDSRSAAPHGPERHAGRNDIAPSLWNSGQVWSNSQLRRFRGNLGEIAGLAEINPNFEQGRAMFDGC